MNYMTNFTEIFRLQLAFWSKDGQLFLLFTDYLFFEYTISDELSVTYGEETIEKGGDPTDAEYSVISASYTAGGMTLSASMKEAENVNHTTAANEDFEYWSLGASFAF